jgi:hypothetical protein
VKKQAKKIPHDVRQLKYLQAIGVLPRVGVAQVEVFHDDWCQHWQRPGTCNCQPEIQVRAAADESRRN